MGQSAPHGAAMDSAERPFGRQRPRAPRPTPARILPQWRDVGPGTLEMPRTGVSGRQRFGARGTIGIGGSLAAPPLPHHRAYGSVHGGSTDLSHGRARHGGKSEPVEEGVGERVGERGAVADPPRAMRTARGLCGQVQIDAEAAQRRKAGASALPLPPDDGAEPSSDPSVEAVPNLTKVATDSQSM